MENIFSVSEINRDEILALDSNIAWKVFIQEVNNKLISAQMLLEGAPGDDIWESTKDGSSVLARVGVRSLQGEISSLRFVLFLVTSFEEELKQLKEEAKDAR